MNVCVRWVGAWIVRRRCWSSNEPPPALTATSSAVTFRSEGSSMRGAPLGSAQVVPKSSEGGAEEAVALATTTAARRRARGAAAAAAA
jgi:hypothetical protein